MSSFLNILNPEGLMKLFNIQQLPTESLSQKEKQLSADEKL